MSNAYTCIFGSVGSEAFMAAALQRRLLLQGSL